MWLPWSPNVEWAKITLIMLSECSRRLWSSNRCHTHVLTLTTAINPSLIIKSLHCLARVRALHGICAVSTYSTGFRWTTCRPTLQSGRDHFHDIVVCIWNCECCSYCNGRVVKFSSEGKYLMEWGEVSSSFGKSLQCFSVPWCISVPIQISFNRNSLSIQFPLFHAFVFQFQFRSSGISIPF